MVGSLCENSIFRKELQVVQVYSAVTRGRVVPMVRMPASRQAPIPLALVLYEWNFFSL